MSIAWFRSLLHRERLLLRWLGPRLLLPVLLSTPAVTPAAHASTFEIYCVNNSDGTSSCEGWDGGETLVCTPSSGGITSCSSSSGSSFTCVRGRDGTTTCDTASGGGRQRDGTRCIRTGQGSISCDADAPPAPDLLPGPRLPSTGPDLDLLIPRLNGSLEIPSLVP